MGSESILGLDEEQIREFFANGYVQLQLAVVVGLLALSWLATKITKRRFHALAENPDSPDLIKKSWSLAESLIGPVYLLTFCLLTAVGFAEFGETVAVEGGSSNSIINPVTTIASAWATYRFVAVFIKGRAWLGLIAVFVFTIAVLRVVDYLLPYDILQYPYELLESTRSVLDGLNFPIGDEKRISLLDIINGIGILLFLLWITSIVSKLLEKRFRSLPNVPPSLQVLLTKLARVVLFFFSVLVALSTMGLDLSSFALLGGAIGVGIGFGLQKVVSNLVSGLILLLDRSIKPGDVIEIDKTYGWINSLRARYASVITRDGKEHLIPNEDLITNKVINWSFSHKDVRVRSSIGISYEANPRQAMDLCLDAAKAEPRVINDPEPKCLLIGFGDNSIELELRFWIADPSNGVGNIRSEVLLGIWDRFEEAGIEIPFPQRDVHLKSSAIEGLENTVPLSRIPAKAESSKTATA